MPFVANGEIGMAIGFLGKGRNPKTKNFRGNPEVEFSSQPGNQYQFRERDFGDEANPMLELTYALMVHKARGSVL